MPYINPTEVSPKVYSELLANDHVRVLEMRLGPGESDAVHSHGNETAHFISGGKVRISVPNEGTDELAIPDGFTMWHEAWTHQVENIGDTEIYAIVVEARGTEHDGS
jgi:mannose-6-phosphate isomerase-like protein (cupin superfamily)